MSNIWEEGIRQEPEEFGLPKEEEPLSSNVVELMHLGRLSKTVTIGGHEISIRTLKIGEELEIGVLTRDYIGTTEENRAYATATVAAAIHSLNGNPLVEPLGPDDKERVLERKFQYIRNNWFWPVIQVIYTDYVELQQQTLAAVQELVSK